MRKCFFLACMRKCFHSVLCSLHHRIYQAHGGPEPTLAQQDEVSEWFEDKVVPKIKRYL